MKPIAPLALLIACVCITGCAPRKPKVLAPLAKVEVRLLDYRGQPLAHHAVRVERPRPGRDWGVDKVARGNTDAVGRITFKNLQEEDQLRVETMDRRFWLRRSLAAGDTAYTERVDEFGIIVATYLWGMEHEHLREAVDTTHETLRKIIGHYVRTGAQSFESPTHYVASGVITQREADLMLGLRPAMARKKGGVAFLWGRERAAVGQPEDPLRWVREEER